MAERGHAHDTARLRVATGSAEITQLMCNRRGENAGQGESRHLMPSTTNQFPIFVADLPFPRHEDGNSAT